ncbi:MAG: chorismate--pyruvate lyase [Acetatifactor sp.]
MKTFHYIVESIDGDYTYLRCIDEGMENEDLKLVARALLPPEIAEGTRLLYEWMEYSII